VVGDASALVAARRVNQVSFRDRPHREFLFARELLEALGPLSRRYGKPVQYPPQASPDGVGQLFVSLWSISEYRNRPPMTARNKKSDRGTREVNEPPVAAFQSVVWQGFGALQSAWDVTGARLSAV